MASVHAAWLQLDRTNVMFLPACFFISNMTFILFFIILTISKGHVSRNQGFDMTSDKSCASLA